MLIEIAGWRGSAGRLLCAHRGPGADPDPAGRGHGASAQRLDVRRCPMVAGSIRCSGPRRWLSWCWSGPAPSPCATSTAWARRRRGWPERRSKPGRIAPGRLRDWNDEHRDEADPDRSAPITPMCTTSPRPADRRTGAGGSLAQRFTARLGRWHDQPVGPHSRGMYQVLFATEQFARIVPWLMLNRRRTGRAGASRDRETISPTTRGTRCGSASRYRCGSRRCRTIEELSP